MWSCFLETREGRLQPQRVRRVKKLEAAGVSLQYLWLELP